MTRTPNTPTQWVRNGTNPDYAHNTAAKLLRTTNSSSRSLGKINILNSVQHKLHWNVMRPDGGGIKPLIRYRN